MTVAETHTVDEALERFELIRGTGRPEQNTGCAMTVLSWVAGDAWAVTPPCAHRLLASWTIRANDDATTTAEERADIVRAGATGIIDTWWVPAEVLLHAWAAAPKDARPAARMVAIANTVADWKASLIHARPNLMGADLMGANLMGANLGGANLRGANLVGANLMNANLVGANLVGANLAGANLAGANLMNANLMNANLMDADLMDARLGGAYATEWTIWPTGVAPLTRGVIVVAK